MAYSPRTGHDYAAAPVTTRRVEQSGHHDLVGTKQIGFAGGVPTQVLLIGIDGVTDFLNLPKRRDDRLPFEDRRYLFFDPRIVRMRLARRRRRFAPTAASSARPTASPIRSERSRMVEVIVYGGVSVMAVDKKRPRAIDAGKLARLHRDKAALFSSSSRSSGPFLLRECHQGPTPRLG